MSNYFQNINIFIAHVNACDPQQSFHLQHDNDNYNPIFGNNHFMVNRFHVFEGVVFRKVYQNSFKVNGNNMDGWLGFFFTHFKHANGSNIMPEIV